MKSTYKLMIIAILGSLVLPFIIPGPDGKPVMDWRPLVDPQQWQHGVAGVFQRMRGAVRDSVEQLPELGDVLAGESDDQYYRWQDENGVWHFSDTPPPDREFEQLKLPEVANPLPVQLPEANTESSAKNQSSQSLGLGLPTPKAVQDAKAIQALLDQRAEDLEPDQ